MVATFVRSKEVASLDVLSRECVHFFELKVNKESVELSQVQEIHG